MKNLCQRYSDNEGVPTQALWFSSGGTSDENNPVPPNTTCCVSHHGAVSEHTLCSPNETKPEGELQLLMSFQIMGPD